MFEFVLGEIELVGLLAIFLSPMVAGGITFWLSYKVVKEGEYK